MAFLIKGEFFKEYSRAIVLCVYTDMVTALAVACEHGVARVLDSAIEPQEGVCGAGADSAEKILFNCEKALQALAPSARAGMQDYIIVLGAGIGQFSCVHTQWTRDDKEKKITAQEITAHTEKWQGKEEDAAAFSFRAIPQRFWVDGFAVSDTVGLNGKEITADSAVIACDNALTRGFEELAKSSGMRIRGMTDIRCAALSWKPIFAENEHALIVMLFETETDVLLIRAGACAGIGVYAHGYGILHEEIARACAVGKEEARGLLRAFRAGALSAAPIASVKEIIGSAQEEAVKGVGAVTAGMDPSNILPGNVWIMASAESPEIEEALSAAAWLSGVPLERGAKVRNAAKEGIGKGGGRPVFESALLDYLSL